MNRIQSLMNALKYIENNLTNPLSIEEISRRNYASSSHFQLLFHVVMGITIGDYIRNRRLSLAALDLLQPKSRIIDVALRYQYDTQESFSKAFSRFHGMPPSQISKVKQEQIRFYNPLTINLTVQGGFDMSRNFINEFHLLDLQNAENQEDITASEKYDRIVNWAAQARGQNPNVFDALTEWILDDSQWGNEEQLCENEQILIHGVFARFKEQNSRLRKHLKELSGVVNTSVFKALDKFDVELSGVSQDERLRETVAEMFADFSVMKDRKVREKIAGNKTGSLGIDSVEIFGYINYLKDCDAKVQWALFMPNKVKKQQNGFKVDTFEYRKLPAMRFIGREDGDLDNMKARKEMFRSLDEMSEFKSGFDYDVLLMHHYGLCTDVGLWHGFWGRFMKADTPVPEGFMCVDFVSQDSSQDSKDNEVGPPYYSQFAFATFTGDYDAMHKTAGYDNGAMYDVTRNIILGQGVNIPYPNKYWVAEVFLDGCDNYSSAYMFSVKD